MSTNKMFEKNFENADVNVRIKLSALWITLMFCYTYADILGFYSPGNLEEHLAGNIAGIEMTQNLLLGSAALMIIPSIMIYLTVALRIKTSRIVNLIVAAVYLIVLAATFFTGRNPAYYILFALVKACMLGLILWHAVKKQG